MAQAPAASLADRVRTTVDASLPETAIEVQDLEKTYPNGTKAVRGIAFKVKRGEIFGILGPNGAGKSTAIGILGTLVRPTGGRAFVDGIDVVKEPNRVKTHIGFAMQEAGVDELATGLEFLTLQGRLYGLSKETARGRAVKLLKIFDIEAAGAKRIGSYSGGMKRRIDLASALIHLPRILFLDEPTEGLDPRSRHSLWESLRRLNTKLGVTILLSTHYMEEADALCHRLAIIDQGKIVVEGTPRQLKATLGGQVIVLEYEGVAADRLPKAERVLAGVRGIRDTRRVVDRLHLAVDDAPRALPEILKRLEASGVGPKSLRIQDRSLDDVYLHYTGRTIATAEAKPEIETPPEAKK